MPASDQAGSQQLLQALVGMKPLEEIAEGTFFRFLILDRLYWHIYEHVPPNDTAEVEKDFLPNRHAAVHGLLASRFDARNAFRLGNSTSASRGAFSVANAPPPPASSPGPTTEDACVALRKGVRCRSRVSGRPLRQVDPDRA